MNVAFESSFARDLKCIRNQTLRQQVQNVIDEVKAATALAEIHSMRKMQGYTTFYRIRLGDYLLD